MPTPFLPYQRDPIAGDQTTPNGWYEFFRSLRDLVESSGLEPGVIESILARLSELEANQIGAFTIQGPLTVEVSGTPESGVVQITLQNDTLNPGNTYYYGTGPTGLKGWFTVESALAAGAAITKTVGLDGVTTIAHADTSSVADLVSDNSNGVVLQDITITFDTFGHVQTATVGTVDLDARYGPALATGGTTGQFWRGDKSWSNTLVGPLVVNTGSISLTGINTGTVSISDTQTMASNNITQQNVMMLQPTLQPQGATLANLFGLIFLPTLNNSSTAINGVDIVHARLDAAAGFTGSMSSVNIFRAQAPTTAFTATTMYRAFRADNPALVTSPLSVAFHSMFATGSGKFNIYADGSAPNFFRGNIGLVTSVQFGGGDGVFSYGNAVTPPSSNPASGVITWAEGSALKARTAGGNIITVASNVPAVVPIYTKSDFPAPVAGVITLVNDVEYQVNANIDLTGDRIVCGTNNVISGKSFASSSVTSTGLAGGSFLLTTTSSLALRDVAFPLTTGNWISANDGATGNLEMDGIAVTNVATLGTIQNYGNVVINQSIFQNSAGLTFDGTFGAVVIETSLLDGRAGATTITVPATAVIGRRFRVFGTSFTNAVGETAINFNAAATVPDESYILDNANFSGGSATFLAGLDYTSNKASFFRNFGIRNSNAIASYSMTGNATATVIAVASTFVKIAGTTVAGSLNQKFTTAVTNRAVYTGAFTSDFRVAVNASMTSGNNQVLRMRIAKNGVTISESNVLFKTSGSGDASAIGTQVFVTLVPTDYIEIFITNDTAANNITVSDLNVTILRLES